MAKLLSLPNELLLDVAAYLAKDATTLANLSACSRLLRGVAQPWLHSFVRIPLPAAIEAAPLRWLRLFLRTISQRPDLAKHVKDVSLIEEPPTHGMAEYLHEQNMRHVDPNDRPTNYQSNNLIIEIFSLLPNVEHIAFTACLKHPKELLQQLHRRMRTDSSFLAKLSTFHLRKEYEKGPVNIRGYVPFFDNPSFTKLTTENNIDAVLGGYPPTNTLTRSSSEFYWTIISPSTLDILLRTCPSQNSFCFVIPSVERFDSRMWDVGRYPLVFPKDLIIGLLRWHGSTLETLHVDHHHGLDFRDLDTREDMHIAALDSKLHDYYYPSFHDFERLTRMMIEFEKLKRLADLPEALEQLVLERCYFSDVGEQYLRDLLRLKAMWCPNIISVDMRGFERTSSGIRAVLALAKSLNVHFFSLEDERVLTLGTSMSAGYSLQLQSRVALPTEEAIYYSDSDEDNDSLE